MGCGAGSQNRYADSGHDDFGASTSYSSTAPAPSAEDLPLLRKSPRQDDSPKSPGQRGRTEPVPRKSLSKEKEQRAPPRQSRSFQLGQFFSNVSGAHAFKEYKPHVDFLRVTSSQKTALDSYVDTVIKEVIRVLEGDRCSIFFVDDVRKEVWCVGSLDMESFCMPWDQGIVGLVAKEGKVLNLADAHQHSAFDPTVEKLTGYAVRSLLCFPIKHMVDENRTIGVIQVLNKISSKQKGRRPSLQGDIELTSPASPQLDTAGFSEKDEMELLKIAMLISDSFHRQRWCALERNACGDMQAISVIMAHSRFAPPRNSKGKSLLCGANKQAMAEKSCTMCSSTDSFQWPEATPALEQASASFRSLEFNALDVGADDLVKLVPLAMQQTGCMERCNIDPDSLRAWAGAARRMYRDNPFHSWFHGFAVYHMCFYQMHASTISNHLRFLDVFALLVAALCHDLDHPGCTNSFLINTEDELALRYNDVSVLENYHASLACELIRKDDTRINEGLSKSSQQIFRRTIIKCILDTDMTHHSTLCQKILEQTHQQAQSDLPESKADDLRQLLLSACIHTADLSAQVLPWLVASQWEAKISLEFSQQAEKEIEVGLSPAPFMQFRFDDLKQRGKLQRDFIDFVLTPLWGPYSDMYHDLQRCYDNLIVNRAGYEHRCIHGKDPERDPPEIASTS